MQKIEVIVRITKGHCPPQEQTIFEWIEMNRAAPDTLNYPGLEINLEHRRVFKNGQEVYMSRYEYGVLSLMARHGERRPMNAICDTTAKSETISVKGCKVKITYASADTDCLDAIQKLLQTTILRTAGHTAA